MTNSPTHTKKAITNDLNKIATIPLQSQKPNVLDSNTVVKRHFERKKEKEARKVAMYIEKPSSTEVMKERR